MCNVWIYILLIVVQVKLIHNLSIGITELRRISFAFQIVIFTSFNSSNAAANDSFPDQNNHSFSSQGWVTPPPTKKKNRHNVTPFYILWHPFIHYGIVVDCRPSIVIVKKKKLKVLVSEFKHLVKHKRVANWMRSNQWWKQTWKRNTYMGWQ